MPANDEFPRGWVLHNESGAVGTQASITVPAVAGIAHVLSQVDWTLENFAGASNFDSFVDVLIAGVLATRLSLTTVAAGTIRDSGTWGGKFQAPLNTSLQVRLSSVVVAGVTEVLVIQGYDV